MSSVNIKRSEHQLAPPVRLPRAFSDPERVLELVRLGAPYKTLTAVHRHPGEEFTGGWFRRFWALGGKITFEGADDAFHNPAFIEAARSSFKAEIIRPVTMMVNLNLPAEGLPPHQDLPFFRGAMNREVPSWILEPMGYSGLFADWAVPVASAISWFYDGEGGDFEYWPDGLEAPSESARPPYFNQSVLADNEYMYHRVGATGRPDRYVREDQLPTDCLLETRGDGWTVTHREEELLTYARDEVRISILWKAFCFKDQAMADAFDRKEYDLSPDMITDIFLDDLVQRGQNLARPQDPYGDLAWKELLCRTYSAGNSSG